MFKGIFNNKKTTTSDKPNNQQQKAQWEETPKANNNEDEDAGAGKNYTIIQKMNAFDLKNRTGNNDSAGSTFDLSSADIKAFYDANKPVGYTQDTLNTIVNEQKINRREDFLVTNLSNPKDVTKINSILFNFDKKFNTNIIGNNTADIDKFLDYYGFTTQADKQKAKGIIQQSVKQYKQQGSEHYAKEIKLLTDSRLIDRSGGDIFGIIKITDIKSDKMLNYLSATTGLNKDNDLLKKTQELLVNQFKAKNLTEISPDRLMRILQNYSTSDVTEKSLTALLKGAENGTQTTDTTPPPPPPPPPPSTTPTPPPVSSTSVTQGFKSADALYRYLVSDNDKVDLKTAKNMYKTMLNTKTLTSAQEKIVSDVFNKTAGINKTIDSSEMLKFVDALNGNNAVTFNPNAKETDRLIDKDGLKKTGTTPPPPQQKMGLM